MKFTNEYPNKGPIDVPRHIPISNFAITFLISFSSVIEQAIEKANTAKQAVAIPWSILRKKTIINNA